MNQQVVIEKRRRQDGKNFTWQCSNDGFGLSACAGNRGRMLWVINRPNGHARQRIGGKQSPGIVKPKVA